MQCASHLLWLTLALTPAPQADKTAQPLRLGQPVAAIVVPTPHRPSIAFSPDGKKLAWMHQQPDKLPNDGGGLLINLWDLGKKIPLQEMTASNDFTYACSPIRFSPDGRKLAAGCFQLTTEHELLAKKGTAVWNNVRVWLVFSGRELPGTPKENGVVEGMWQAVAFNPDGKTLTAVTSGGGKLWQLPEVKMTSKFNLDNATHLILSADGKLAAGTLADKTVHVWTATEGDDAGKEQFKLPGTGRPLGFSPDSKQLAFFTGDKLCLSELQGNKEIWTIPGKLGSDEKFGQRFDFSPDGKRLAWNEDGKITIVSAATGKTLTTIKAEPGPIAFSPDGGRLALACPDGTALVWEMGK